MLSDEMKRKISLYSYTELIREYNRLLQELTKEYPENPVFDKSKMAEFTYLCIVYKKMLAQIIAYTNPTQRFKDELTAQEDHIKSTTAWFKDAVKRGYRVA